MSIIQKVKDFFSLPSVVENDPVIIVDPVIISDRGNVRFVPVGHGGYRYEIELSNTYGTEWRRVNGHVYSYNEAIDIIVAVNGEAFPSS